MLKVQNLKKHFGGVKAVDNCSFKIGPGKITALIGPNGAGKSTVFNLISGLLKMDAGRVIFNHQDITHYSPEKISNIGISRLFQKSTLFKNLTIKENLLLATDNEDMKFWRALFGSNKIPKDKEKRIEQMLELLEMKTSINKLTRDLSYGQKRLIELLRTILSSHQLLMLDEPVAGVNPKLRQKIVELLRQLKSQGETILLIEHDMDFTLALADVVIVMDEGQVLTQGTPDQIRNSKKVLEAYLGEWKIWQKFFCNVIRLK